jgi:hypothetical protein
LQETQKRSGWQPSLKRCLQLQKQANSNFTSRAGIKLEGAEITLVWSQGKECIPSLGSFCSAEAELYKHSDSRHACILWAHARTPWSIALLLDQRWVLTSVSSANSVIFSQAFLYLFVVSRDMPEGST